MWDSTRDGSGTTGGFTSKNIAGSSRENAVRVRNIVPVMIGLLHRTKGELKVLGKPVHIVSILGILRSVEESATKETYIIEDQTGTITAFRWLEAEKSSSSPTFKIDTYVRVYGHLREQNDVPHILMLKMMPMTELNELTTHLLEVMYIALKSKKMAAAEKEKIEKMEVVDAGSSNSNIKDNISGLSREQSLVLNVIRAEDKVDDTGIHKSVLIQKVPQYIAPKLDAILDFLSGEGHLYTTLNNDYFKAT
ncbi:replication protein A 32 kDa subunit-like [Augochlora pura]